MDIQNSDIRKSVASLSAVTTRGTLKRVVLAEWDAPWIVPSIERREHLQLEQLVSTGGLRRDTGTLALETRG